MEIILTLPIHNSSRYRFSVIKMSEGSAVDRARLPFNFERNFQFPSAHKADRKLNQKKKKN